MTRARKPLRRVWLLLQSRKLALVLLMVITAAIVVASIVPQRVSLSPGELRAWQQAHSQLSGILGFLLLDRIYTSWWFLTAVAFILVNTLACTVARVSGLLRKEGREPAALAPDEIARFANSAQLRSSTSLQQATAAAATVLEQKRYYIRANVGGGGILGQKGWLGEWGSLLFHFSFMIVLAGVVYSLMTRYVGVMVITEGQTITEERQGYLVVSRMPLLGQPHRGFLIRLDRFQPAYDQRKTGIDYTADVTVLDQGREVKRARIKVNQPLQHRGTSFILKRYGFAPEFALRDEEGKETFRAFVNLRVLGEGSEDFFAIPETSLQVRVRLYPDAITVEGGMATHSLLPENPVAHLRVTDGTREVFQGLVPLNGEVALDRGSLAFTGLRYWAQYKVVKDAGKPFIFGGLWLGLMGLILRYFFVRKRVWVTIEERQSETTITLGGRAEQCDALYAREFADIVADLRKEIDHGPG